MTTKIVETFYPVDIANVAIKFEKETTAVTFGCTATLSAETEMRTIAAKCGAETIQEISKPIKMTATITGHAPVSVLRRIFGLSNEGLTEGVYAYGLDSKGEGGTLTADIVDDFNDLVKIMAFPTMISVTGFKFTVDKGSDEVAPVELEFTCKPDEFRKFYYEAFADELEDDELADKWRKNFSYELVKKGSANPKHSRMTKEDVSK
ncbi:structural component [Enterococcus mundtii 1A]|uniref:phage tail protein n=1 Tax=Enterococcus mundtii TaxID=53346 RepID=UPI002302AAB8|nr:phage tail protein [Enterococcus mundtii]MDA9429143.1 structural component [Enterococcus mundtii 1A]